MSRTVTKTLSYSLTHLGVAMVVAFGLTHDWRVALGIGLIEPAVQTLVYALHERAWACRSRGPVSASRLT